MKRILISVLISLGVVALWRGPAEILATGTQAFEAVVAVTDARGAQATAATLPAERPMAFSAVKQTGGDDPHAYGIVIEVFRHDGVWTGFMSEYVGPVADPPSARLDDLRVDEGTRQVTFAAVVPIGVTMPAGTNTWVPALSRYDFSGTIAADRVAGVLVKWSADNPSATPTREDVVLTRDLSRVGDLAYDAWIAIWRARLRDRHSRSEPGPPPGKRGSLGAAGDH